MPSLKVVPNGQLAQANEELYQLAAHICDITGSRVFTSFQTSSENYLFENLYLTTEVEFSLRAWT